MRVPLAVTASRVLTILAAVGIAATPAQAQVEIDLSVSPFDRLLPHHGFGNESMTVFGTTEDDRDNLLLVRVFEQGAACETDAPLRVYRQEADGSWVIEAGIDPILYQHPVPAASSGDTLVIGDAPGFRSFEGRALVYRRIDRQWVLESELRADEPGFWDFYGEAVAIDGDTIIVGAPNFNSGSTATNPRDGEGAAFVYRRTGSTWDLVRRFDNPARDPIAAEFGSAVDVVEQWHGAEVAIGAPGLMASSGGRGHVYRYVERDGWASMGGKSLTVGGDAVFGTQVGLGTTAAVYAGNTAAMLMDTSTPLYDIDLLFAIPGGTGDRVDAHFTYALLGYPDFDSAGADAGSFQLWDRVTTRSEYQDETPAFDWPLDAGDRLGDRVTLSSDTIAVAAPGDDDAGPNAGVVYTWDRNPLGGWLTGERISVGFATPNGRMGTSFAATEERLFVGVPGGERCDKPGGMVFTYTKQGRDWAPESRIQAPDVSATADFGAAVDVDGVWAVVGAPMDGDLAEGSAHVYQNIAGEWTLVRSLRPDGVEADARYGATVAMDGEWMAVAAPEGRGGAAEASGFVEIYRRVGSDWTLQRRLDGGDALAGRAEIGAALSLEGDRLLIGAPGAAMETGAVLALEAPFTGAPQVIEADLAMPGERFGHAVAFDGDHALVGAPGTGADQGTIYTAEFSGAWSAPEEIAGLPTTAGARLGTSLDLLGRAGIAGAPGAGVASMVYRTSEGWQWFADRQGDAAAGYGQNVMLVGDLMLVAAPEDGTLTERGGSVEVDLFDYSFEVVECPDTADPQPIDTVINPDREAFDLLGYSIAVSGDAAVIGAPYEAIEYLDPFGTPRTDPTGGTAYVYRRVEPYRWEREADLNRLIGVDPAIGWFGWSVDMLGDRILVGAPEADTPVSPRGGAYLFERTLDGWQRTHTLLPRDGLPITPFGVAVGMSERTLGAGQPEMSVDAIRPGVVWVSEREGPVWLAPDILSPLQPQDGEKFGRAIEVTDQWLFVGAPNHTVGTSQAAGRVVVFRWTGDFWTEHLSLFAPMPVTLDRFGTDIACFGDTLVIGAPYGDGMGVINSGVGHVFEFDAATELWTHRHELSSADADGGDHIGFSVAVSEFTIALGGYGLADPVTGTSSGAVAVFKPDGSGGWTEAATHYPATGSDLERFGHDVALEGGNLWVAAPYADDDPAGVTSLFDSGRAYTIDLECASPCPIDLGAPFGVVDVFDFLAFLDLFGRGDPAADINGDGILDTFDFLEFLNLFGAGC
ncbi:MAG: GC-type dockerin domain-anchored protein [Phycisphaerales bacterium]